jgi:hypothetical protein
LAADVVDDDSIARDVINGGITGLAGLPDLHPKNA